MPQNSKFELVETSHLRQQERSIWSHHNLEIFHFWQTEFDDEQKQKEAVQEALNKELAQIKDNHQVYIQQGKLFFPASYDQIKRYSDNYTNQ